MAEHTVNFRIPTQTMRNVDVICRPRSDGVLLGTLKLSKGGVDWTPARNTVNKTFLPWGKFASLLEAEQLRLAKRRRSRARKARSS